MDIQQLVYFIATAECLNVSRAAIRCHVAQPSLSQQLQRLERYLGVRLFDRLGRGVALTDAGRALLPRARKILAEVREAETNIKREAQEWHGSLAVGAIPTMAPYLLPTALGKLRNERPECEFTVREDLTEALVEAVADHQIDCAFVSTPLAHPLLEIEVLAEEDLLVAIGGGRAKRSRSTITVPDLKTEPIITLHEMHCLGRQIEGFCTASRIAPRVLCRTTQLATVFEMVALGVGVSIVPEMAAAAHRSGRCRFGRIERAKPTRQIAVAWRAGRSRPAAATQLVQIVRHHFEQGLHTYRAKGGRSRREIGKETAAHSRE